ncbi:MAG TPA: hypothetical protein VK009_12200 [Chloroflexota bacterium]|nr:hypothetical protein [Chloroflexota bacterium]
MSAGVAGASNGTVTFSNDINPPATTSFDISYVDNSRGSYFLADRTNKAVDLIDAKTGTFTGSIQGGFQGATNSRATSGPNGVLDDSAGLVWAGDGNSTIKVLNPTPGANLIKSIPTGGTKRADELSYDPADQVILIANDFEGFLTFINVKTQSVATHFYYGDNTVGQPATVSGHSTAGGGIEQSVWDPKTGLFYQAVPACSTPPPDGTCKPVTTGFIDVFSPSGSLVKTYSVPGCTNGPTGLALGKNSYLMGACDNGGAVVEVGSGHVRTIVSGVGGADEVWFNPGDGNFYFGISGTTAPELGVVNGDNAHLVTTISGHGGHSVAAYAGNNHIFDPEKSGSGIAVFASS